MSQPFYVTTPIYYVNDKPHIGHAYTTLAADVLARFHRLDGAPTLFLTGTDEHGEKVAKAAAALGMEPQPFTDQVSQSFRQLAERFAFSHDQFIRTTEPRHHNAAQELWRRLVERGEIYQGNYAGWYAVRDEAYYQENELTVRDGQRFAPSGAPCEWREEPSYFFRLAAWRDRLLAFYEAHPDFIRPLSRRNEVIGFVRQLEGDLSVSRTSFRWGVPVPGDDRHVMYVWIDALTNYITALGFPETDGGPYRQFWPVALHLIGKDILRFHAVYWPAFLLAAGLSPPQQIFAHGWWTNEGQKISKSLGNVIDPFALVDEFGLDPVRYFLLREVPFGQDGDFSRAALIARINGDLANDLGNLAQRVLGFIAKNAGGIMPSAGELLPPDQQLLARATHLLPEVRGQLGELAFHRALEAVWAVIGDGNRYIDEQAPWSLRKSDPTRMATVLFVLLEVVRHIALLLQPFMPQSMARLLDQLAVPAGMRAFAQLNPACSVAPGTALPPPQGVFPRFVEEAA